MLSKFDVKSPNLVLRYQTTRGEFYEVTSDQQLERVVKDAASNGVKCLELKTAGQSASYASSPAHSATSTPIKAATATSTPTKATGSYTPASSPSGANSAASTPTAAPGNRTASHSTPQAGDYHIVTWDLPGDSASVNAKPKISYAQTHDEFSFWPLPCQHSAETRVTLREGSTLIFESLYTFEDVSFGGQKGTSTALVTQKIGLPIKVAPTLVTLEHQKIVIKH